MQNTTTHQEHSRAFLEQAFAELEAGDAREASGKGWDAAAHILKAVAIERGWEHDDYRLLLGVASGLFAETRNDVLRHGFNAALMLYANFHDDVIGRDWVASCLDRLQSFVEAAESLLSSG